MSLMAGGEKVLSYLVVNATDLRFVLNLVATGALHKMVSLLLDREVRPFLLNYYLFQHFRSPQLS